MGLAELGVMIPIIGVSIPLVAIAGSIIQNVLKSQERRMEMRLRAQQGQNEDVTQQLAALRAEVAGLRDTSTQFDMSLEHSVERLEERIGRIETKTAPAVRSVAAPQPEETRHVGLR